jgi:hypothetical protein
VVKFLAKFIIPGTFCLLILGIGRPSPAALSIGGQIGGNFGDEVNLQVSTRTSSTRALYNTVESSLLTGLALEYYFTDKGFLGRPWPDWMKYFSFAVDFTHNPIRFGNKKSQLLFSNDPDWGRVFLPTFNGYVLTLSFLLKYRFPLLKEPDFPDGRLFFYIGAGPGVTFSNLEADNDIGHGTATAVTFVAETGFRLFIVKDVSVDIFFRYRFFDPTYTFNLATSGPPLYVNFAGNTYNAAVRLSFHF